MLLSKYPAIHLTTCRDGRILAYFMLTEAIKRVVNIPVVLTGGITDITIAEMLLKNKKADVIGIGRAILKDSLWAERAILSSQNL